jgi:hypothetical protein
MNIPSIKKATVPRLYKYSSLLKPEHLERLRVIVQEHELYLPNLTQLNDPADGRPLLAPLSGEQLASFLYEGLLQREPNLTLAARQREEAIIRFNVTKHGPETLQRMLTESLHSELQGYRIYSLSKRYDNMNLWAKYAADHSGYCLEFLNEGPLFVSAKDVVYVDSVQIDITNREHLNGFWFFCKRPEWSNEEEVRLVLQRGKGSKVKINPRCLNRLILGKDMSQKHQQQIRDWAKQRMPELTVVNAYYDSVDQRLGLKP